MTDKFIKHNHQWPRAYGEMSKGCPACDQAAKNVVASGCTRNPYSPTCGHAMSSGACGKCKRGTSTS